MNLKDLLPPSIPENRVRDFAMKAYGLEGEWKRLDGERDQNFRVKDKDGRFWTLKICNPKEDRHLVASQVKALEHIAETDPSLP